MADKPTIENTIFCTHFDKNYLLRGLALHSSLLKYEPDVKLWIFAFDKETIGILKKMQLKGVRVVGLTEFEDKELLSIKKTRTKIEYMWTTTSSMPLYIFKKSRETKYVVYLDPDEYFFSSPAAILSEVGGKSLLAVEHRYPKGQEALNELDGRFNVAVNVFKRDKIGLSCLKRWRAQCIEWCYWRLEDGKLGDQLYLNEWPGLYGKNLVISKNIGVNAAPWNISQYKVTQKKGNVYVNSAPLVCYHFHQFEIFGPSEFNRVYGYRLPVEAVENIYKPYEAELRYQYDKLKTVVPSFRIVPPIKYSSQIVRQRMGKYFGPIYWRFMTIAHNLKSIWENGK